MTMLDRSTWTLGDRLRKARQLADLEQADIAKMIGAARTSVSNWETGRTEPSFPMVVRWARATEADLGWLAESVHPLGLEPRTHWLWVCVAAFASVIRPAVTL